MGRQTSPIMQAGCAAKLAAAQLDEMVKGSSGCLFSTVPRHTTRRSNGTWLPL